MGNSNAGNFIRDHHDGSSDPRESGRSRNRMSRGDLGGFLSLQPPRDRGRDRQDAAHLSIVKRDKSARLAD